MVTDVEVLVVLPPFVAGIHVILKQINFLNSV